MASETTTSSQTGLVFSAWLGDRILEEQRPYNVSKPLLKYAGRKPSKVYSFPIQSDPGMAASGQAEGTAFGNTQLQSTKADATARLNGQVATVTDFVDAVSTVDAIGHFGAVLGRSVAEELETTIDSVILNSAWTTTQTASTVLLLDDFMVAIGAIEGKDGVGDLAAVLNPAQTSELRRDLTGTVAASFFGSERGAAVAGTLAEAKMAGAVGNIAGVDVFQTTGVVLSTTYRGAMFVKGEAAGIYEVWDARTEQHRDAFQPGTQLAATSCYGLAQIRADWGVSLRST
jgi:hypothetical protein